jgi:[protein-PII] uridylyltransferase
VLQLASHLGTRTRAQALYAVSALRAHGRERWQLQRLRQLHDGLQAVLSDPELTGDASVVELRRRNALAAVGIDAHAVRRIERAPGAYLLRQPPAAIARQAPLLDPVPRSNDARVLVTEAPFGRWWVDVAVRDRPGALAAVTGALAAAGLSVEDAVVATWDDGAGIESFKVAGDRRPDPEALEAAMKEGITAERLETPPLDDVVVSFDRTASPWHTVCEIRATDRPGLLHAIAAGLFAAGARVVALTVTAEDDGVVDRFELTDGNGAKLGAAVEAEVGRHLASGVTARRRRLGRSLSVR